MNLLKKIESDLKDAIKSSDTVRSGTLKMLKSDIMYEKAKKGGDLDDEKILEVIARAAKKRRESIEEFTKAGRKDLADTESSELVIVESYLPEQLSRDEVEKIIDAKLAELGEVTQKDFGKVMGPLMKELKGKTDGAVVKEILTQKLNK
ncbi:MAG TPA: GatB/YqeY domain-containing protein [Spirochaetota bacterium]|nr:GatB/YqeY domain-containing protein [Spirochaetota bacterium]HPI91428.1 GatB/YqeY domain-containing protein [Spirochaetota bacterium]